MTAVRKMTQYVPLTRGESGSNNNVIRYRTTLPRS